jgi:four helix bundle protein
MKLRVERKIMFNFEKLDIWQKSIDFADLIYNETRTFPSEERFGLTNQLRRAAVSISSNIAEGASRASRTDFARFAEIAAGSVFEAASQTFIARRQSFLSEDQFARIYTDGEELSRMLSGLRRTLLSTFSSQQ